ncbi:MAG: hypothetical protein ACOWWR_04390 [Eubacteriales bacterium]
MKLYEYLNMKQDYIIQHLTLIENESYILEKDFNKELYQYFDKEKEKGYHLLTYNNKDESLHSEFYILVEDLQGLKISQTLAKMKISYTEKAIVFTVNIKELQTVIPITFQLVHEHISFELSQLLKQKNIPVHILSKKMHGYHKEKTFYIPLYGKQKAIITDFIELFLNTYNVIDHQEMITLEDMMIYSNISYIKIPFYREDIEKMDIEKYENMLSVLYPNVLITHDLCEKVDLTIYGYEEDLREIWQIPQIRRFIKALNEKFNHWFYFLDKKTDSLYWITMCLCAKHFGSDDEHIMDTMLFSDFINNQLQDLNHIMYYLNDENKGKEISQGVFKYYGII